MNINKIDNQQIRTIVGKAFIRVMKNHNYYRLFIKSFNDLKNYVNDERNPFGRFNDFNSMMFNIENFVARHDMKNMNRTCLVASREATYNKIIAMINHMLHYFLEQRGVDGRRMGMLGQEVFDLSCYTLFGDEYLSDMERLDNDIPKPKNDMEAYILAEYMKYISNGEKISWEEFVSRFAKQIKPEMFDESLYRDNPKIEYTY